MSTPPHPRPDPINPSPTGPKPAPTPATVPAPTGDEGPVSDEDLAEYKRTHGHAGA